MSNPAHFIGKPVRRESLPEWAREQLPPKGTAKRIRDPDRRGLTVGEAIEKNYVGKKNPIMLYAWSKNGLPALESEILERWYEYEVTAEGRILRFMVFSADQLKRSKEARTLLADALRKSRGISDRQFMNRYPDLFRRADGSLPRRRPTILFYWRNKKHGCPYLPGGRALGHWLEHARIMNDPDDVDAIVKKIRETDVQQWTEPVTGRTFIPIRLAEFIQMTGLVGQEVAQYRDTRPHPALGRKIDFMKGKRSGGRTRLGMGYRYSREDGEKIKKWYEAKANGKVGKPVEAAAFINNLVAAGPVKAGDGTKKALLAGFYGPTFRKGFKLSNAVSS